MVDGRPLVIVDADTVAGWRRAAPSLAQLWQAVDDLREMHPEVDVAVVADPSLRWALGAEEQLAIEEDVRTGRLLYAPAGCTGGHVGFLAEVVRHAERIGLAPVVVTDQHLPGVMLCRVTRDGPRWVFDVSGAQASVVAPARRGRRRRPSSRHHGA